MQLSLFCAAPPEEQPHGGRGEEAVEELEQGEEEVMERSSGSGDKEEDARRGGDESERGRDESEGEVSATSADDAGRGDAGDRADSTPRTRDDERRRLWAGRSARCAGWPRRQA